MRGLLVRWDRETTVTVFRVSPHRKPAARISGGVFGGATYIQPGPSAMWAVVPLAIFKILRSSPAYFRNGTVFSSPTKTFSRGYRPGGVVLAGRKTLGTG